MVAVMVRIGDPFERFVGDLSNSLDTRFGRSRPIQRVEHKNAIVTDNKTGVAEAAAARSREFTVPRGPGDPEYSRTQ